MTAVLFFVGVPLLYAALFEIGYRLADHIPIE